jgi:hypothetical protein
MGGMDLTSLSSNLPRNPSNVDEQAEDEEPASTILMAAFKQAATSVTSLYKAANEQVERSRRDGVKDGYQECLDDLFALLVRLESKSNSDPATREIFKQWALGRRRRLGPRTREYRETSSESEAADRQRSSSPIHPPIRQPEISHPITMVSTVKRSPPPPPTPQMPVFTFEPPQHISRHVPDTTDFKIRDNDSPPPSPIITPPQNVFQQSKSHHNTNGSRGRHVRPRAGNKRRFDTFNDFFDIASLDKLQMGKKGRFQ